MNRDVLKRNGEEGRRAGGRMACLEFLGAISDKARRRKGRRENLCSRSIIVFRLVSLSPSVFLSYSTKERQSLKKSTRRSRQSVNLCHSI